MIQPPFPSTIAPQPRQVVFLTTKTMVRKITVTRGWMIGQAGACARGRGGYPKKPRASVHSPPPPPRPPEYCARDARHETRHADKRAYEPQNEPETACWDAFSALLRDRPCVPLFLAGVFDMLNRGHRNRLSSCRLGCHLGSRFGMRFGSFGGRLGSRLGRGLQPLWQFYEHCARVAWPTSRLYNAAWQAFCGTARRWPQ